MGLEGDMPTGGPALPPRQRERQSRKSLLWAGVSGPPQKETQGQRLGMRR